MTIADTDSLQPLIPESNLCSGDQSVNESIQFRFDRQSMRMLESLTLNSFENVLNVFEEFLSGVPLFEGITSFAAAALAFDAAAVAFSAIDANHDFLMTKIDLENYLSECDQRSSVHLKWLVANFPVLEQLSLFVGSVSRDEIELARDVFHGLSYVQKNIDAIHPPSSKGKLAAADLSVHLAKFGRTLESHDARGLAGLAAHIRAIESAESSNKINKSMTHGSTNKLPI